MSLIQNKIYFEMMIWGKFLDIPMKFFWKFGYCGGTGNIFTLNLIITKIFNEKSKYFQWLLLVYLEHFSIFCSNFSIQNNVPLDLTKDIFLGFDTKKSIMKEDIWIRFHCYWKMKLFHKYYIESLNSLLK